MTLKPGRPHHASPLTGGSETTVEAADDLQNAGNSIMAPTQLAAAQNPSSRLDWFIRHFRCGSLTLPLLQKADQSSKPASLVGCLRGEFLFRRLSLRWHIQREI